MFLTYISRTYLMTYGKLSSICYKISTLIMKTVKRNLHNTARSLLYYENFYKLKQGLTQKIFLSDSR